MEGARIPYLPEPAVKMIAGLRMSAAALGGFALLVMVRALTLPGSLWELDEMLFALSLERFEPLAHHPHPPGYPLLVGLGNLFQLVFGDPFRSLVALSFLSSLISYPALVAAFRRIAGEERVAAGRSSGERGSGPRSTVTTHLAEGGCPRCRSGRRTRARA